MVGVLLASEPQFVAHWEGLASGFRCEQCYQLLGVDVILDADLNPRCVRVQPTRPMVHTRWVRRMREESRGRGGAGRKREDGGHKKKRIMNAYATRNSESAHHAHTKHLGWHVEFEFRVTHTIVPAGWLMSLVAGLSR